MRPINTEEKGKTPRKSRRGQKAINGVKKSLVKAKVSAVKTTRKLQSKNADEVEDLLEMTANGNPATPAGKKVTEKVTKASKQMKKLKSLVEVSAKNGGSPGSRKSERLRKKQSSVSEPKVEVGVEAMEINGHANGTNGSDTVDGNRNGGLLQRTISKIWRIPEGIKGVPYEDINAETPKKSEKNPEKSEAVKDDAAGAKNTSCVIS